MPTAATTAGGTRQSTGAGQQQARPVATVPFIRASAEHVEPTGIDVSTQITASGRNIGVFDIPAYGYVRSLLILVEATGGVNAGTSTFAEDGPWTALTDIALTEPNGAVIAQFQNGYELFLANKWGGYRPFNDPRSAPNYTAVAGAAASGNFSYMLRIPVELSMRDALGALPNQNAAATFKLRVNLNSSAGVYSSAPTTLPTVRVRVFLEAWDQPEASAAGAVNQTTPPALNTTQFWSTQQYNVNAGLQNIRLTRVGNYIRNLVFTLRRAGTTRSTGETDWPDPLRLFLDTRPVMELNKAVFNHYLWERNSKTGAAAGDTAGLKDNGVYVIDFTHEFDGVMGQEMRDLWLPTMGSTRLEVQGQFGTAGTLTVQTNDVAIAGPVFT
jgi:hypothetical protein